MATEHHDNEQRSARGRASFPALLVMLRLFHCDPCVCSSSPASPSGECDHHMPERDIPGTNFWPTVLSFEPLAHCVVCRRRL